MPDVSRCVVGDKLGVGALTSLPYIGYLIQSIIVYVVCSALWWWRGWRVAKEVRWCTCRHQSLLPVQGGHRRVLDGLYNDIDHVRVETFAICFVGAHFLFG